MARNLALACLGTGALALDNGYRLPPMGWSSWYGFTQNIDEGMVRGMADGMVQSGLQAAGYEHVWIDDGWAMPRDNVTHKPGVQADIFPSGMRALSDYVHAKGLKFGIYTSKGPLTCLGTQKTQPQRPGSCGFEQIDADTYAHDWQVDQVKDDGCGGCPGDLPLTPFQAMRDALNRTGRPIVYAIHSDGKPWLDTSDSNGSVANMWRTGGDLSASNYEVWLNRLDLATDPRMAAYVGPGSFANPDFLEVGYTPRQPKSFGARVQSLLERRSMFTMWAALPAPLILSADLRPGAASGGIDDKEIMDILTNAEVIAVNQDEAALPMVAVRKAQGLEVWKKPLAAAGSNAVVLFHRNDTMAAAAAVPQPAPQPEQPQQLTDTPVAGMVLTTVACAGADPLSSSFDHDARGITLRSNPSLCVGTVSTATCANPPSPRLGAVACDPSDPSQAWSFPAGLAAGPIVNTKVSPQSDINSAMTCPGDTWPSLLLYVRQDHRNEQWVYDVVSGFIKFGSSPGTCLAYRAELPTPTPAPTPPTPAPTPAPPTPAPAPRTVAVSWAELGFGAADKYAVRDLWAKADLGVFAGGFNASIAPHEARIYTFVPAVAEGKQ
jgi:hypothetical protein